MGGFGVWLGIALLGLIDAWQLIRGSGRRDRRIVCFESVSDAGGAVAAYLATYLLPFIFSPPTRPGDIAAYAVYFGVIFVIYIRSEMAVVNPTPVCARATRCRGDDRYRPACSSGLQNAS